MREKKKKHLHRARIGWNSSSEPDFRRIDTQHARRIARHGVVAHVRRVYRCGEQVAPEDVVGEAHVLRAYLRSAHHSRLHVRHGRDGAVAHHAAPVALRCSARADAYRAIVSAYGDSR